MKKSILIVMLVLVALSVVGVGFAAAQGVAGPGPRLSNGEGPLHDYIVKAYADVLKLTPDILEARLDKGETVYQIALSQGIAAAQIPTLLKDARSKALDAAVAAGVITADQAKWMKSRGFGQGGYGIGAGPRNGSGRTIGSGIMRGSRWARTNR